MARTTTNKMNHVVSCRVNDREMDTLRLLARKSGVSITTLLRQSLNLSQQDTLPVKQSA